jgi:hypothetical protein
MKFWELISAFREEPDIIVQTLRQGKWRKYFDQYKRFEEIVRKQQRDILDEELPFDLCYEVADKSNREYWLSFGAKPQVLYNYRPEIADLERLFPGEILVRFGGEKIVEAHEYSYANVQPRPLNGCAEVIGSYKLTSLGLLFIMRTERSKLPNDCTISTIDNSKKWKVKGEFKHLIVDPYSALEKLEAQKKQNILDYLLDGIGHSEKAKPGELLKLIEGQGSR